MALVRFPLSSARFRQVFYSVPRNAGIASRSLQTFSSPGRSKLYQNHQALVKPCFTPIRTGATKDVICGICDFIGHYWIPMAVLTTALVFLYTQGHNYVCMKCSWRHLSFAGREIPWDDFVSKYLSSGEVVRVHHFTDDRVWVERAYEPDMRRWMNHFEKEIDKEIDAFLKCLGQVKLGDDPKRKAYVQKASAGMKEVKSKRRLKRILKKIARILSRSPESMQKIAALIDRMTKDMTARADEVKKAVDEIESGDVHKPLTDVIVRMKTADEMLRVFIEISEYEHVYFHVDSRDQLSTKLDAAMAKLKLRPEKRASISDHTHRSIEILL